MNTNDNNNTKNSNSTTITTTGGTSNGSSNNSICSNDNANASINDGTTNSNTVTTTAITATYYYSRYYHSYYNDPLVLHTYYVFGNGNNSTLDDSLSRTGWTHQHERVGRTTSPHQWSIYVELSHLCRFLRTAKQFWPFARDDVADSLAH